MDTQKQREETDIQEIYENYIENLSSRWNNFYGPQICSQHLIRLRDHLIAFFDNIVEETGKTEKDIVARLQAYKDEAEELRRLLNTEVSLPPASDDMPIVHHLNEMDKSLDTLRECLRRKKAQITELLLEQESLCSELGEQPRELLADPLPTLEELDDFTFHLEELKSLRFDRINQVSVLRQKIKKCQKILNLKTSTDLEDRLLHGRQIKLTIETIEKLEHLHNKYMAQVQELKHRIDDIRQKLDKLWDRLDTSSNIRENYKRYNNEYSQSVYEILMEELQRCEALKQQNLKKFIQQIRKEIVEMWDKTCKSQQERTRFTHFNSVHYTDDLLMLHEMELDDLKAFYETNQQIFQLFIDRNVLWDRMIALENTANDPGRFNNRGGQLLKEEKERKTITTKLPRIEKQIKELVQAFEEREHSPFTLNGVNILDVMEQAWQSKRDARDKLNSALKSNKTTPMSRSQLLMSTGRTPLSLRNASTISSTSKTSTTRIRPTNQPMSTCQKRKLAASRENLAPVAKRSLISSLNSPSVFRKPVKITITPATPARQRTVLSKLKKTSKLIATTIRRRSSLTKNSAKKRLSESRRRSRTDNISYVHDGCAAAVVDDNVPSSVNSVAGNGLNGYESFEKSISPDSRSSIMPTKSTENIYNMSGMNTHHRIPTIPRITKKIGGSDKKNIKIYYY